MAVTSALNPDVTKTFLSKRTKRKVRKKSNSSKTNKAMPLSSAMKAKVGLRKSKTIKKIMPLTNIKKNGGSAKIMLSKKKGK